MLSEKGKGKRWLERVRICEFDGVSLIQSFKVAIEVCLFDAGDFGIVSPDLFYSKPANTDYLGVTDHGTLRRR